MDTRNDCKISLFVAINEFVKDISESLSNLILIGIIVCKGIKRK